MKKEAVSRDLPLDSKIFQVTRELEEFSKGLTIFAIHRDWSILQEKMNTLNWLYRKLDGLLLEVGKDEVDL